MRALSPSPLCIFRQIPHRSRGRSHSQPCYTLLGKESPDVFYVGLVKDGYLQQYEVEYVLCILVNYSCKSVSASAQIVYGGVPTTLNTCNSRDLKP